MERLIATDMLFYLRNNNLITKHQHGFLIRHSTCTQFIETTNDWSIGYENRFSVDSAYLDFVKAFDTVSDDELLFKLKSYGICGNLLAWIKAFLTNRLQHVQVGNCLSSLINVISDVLYWGPYYFSFTSIMFLICLRAPMQPCNSMQTMQNYILVYSMQIICNTYSYV